MRYVCTLSVYIGVNMFKNMYIYMRTIHARPARRIPDAVKARMLPVNTRKFP